MPDWQKAAGGKMEFDVASIRPAEPDSRIRSSFALNFENETTMPRGLMSASLPLAWYIQFAYKIMLTPDQVQSMMAHLPKWAATDNFVIEARSDSNPTVDQMRLMMQSLLADRFKLAVHFETRTLPVLTLVTLKMGQTGPRLRPHSEGLACETKWIAPPDRSASSVAPAGFLPSCHTIQAISGPNHSVLLGARNITLEHLASYLPLVEDLGRPVVDQTGLRGTYDFSLNWTPDPNAPLNFGGSEESNEGGSDLLAALKQQLGLKLKPVNAPISVLVIDHVEQPSPN
jgi:uncharacterized protein (TIGR03435 family)